MISNTIRPIFHFSSYLCVPLLFVLLLSSWVSPVDNHPFKMSIVELDYRHQQDSVEWRVYYFLDDLKTILYNDPYHPTLEASEVEAYTRAHLSISINGEVTKFDWKGLKTRGLQIMATFSAPALSTSPEQQWHIQNDIMIKSFPDHVNIHYLLLPEGKKELLMLNADQKEGEITVK